MPAQLSALLVRLADGCEFREARRWGDEHVRWALYQEALRHPQLEGTLKEALSQEPDEFVASSVVVLALERETEADAMAPWVAAMPADRRTFVERRAIELLTLSAVRHPDHEGGVDVQSWTQWLQRQAAETSTSLAVLALLARDGRTRKVRNIAHERSRVLARRARRTQ